MNDSADAVLSDRARRVLKDVVYAYILRAEPVSSRAIAKQYDMSAATIRNVLADLDDWGLLRQPHTSAGRVPTAKGYHVYIDSLMQDRDLAIGERTLIQEGLSKAGDSQALASAASHLLSELSSQVGIVLVPARGDVTLRSIDFVPVPGRRVLCVVVSDTGFVDHRVIEVEEPICREDLVRVSNYLTSNFAGMTLFEARTRLLRMMADEKAQVDRIMQQSILLASRGLDASPEPGVVLEGAESLLDQPELADVQRVRKLFETFSDKARLVSMLTKCIEGDGVRVLIGDDSALTSELDFSLVATHYGTGGQTLGSLGVFGPSRMEYPRLIPLVHFLGQAMSSALEQGLEPD